jgi:hypothetical protein
LKGCCQLAADLFEQYDERRKVVAEVARQLHSEYGEAPFRLGGLSRALLRTAYSKLRWRQISRERE